jgi:DNA-binding transcriptional LysR family regulator
MSGQVDLRHLRAFVTVAEELNFSRAAKRLHLVQQALSAQIRQLEDELGVQLFTRTTRKVELSDAGQVLLGHARSILGSISVAYTETRRAGAGETGQLAIAYTPSLAAESLPRVVDEIHLRRPGLQLQMCEMWQAEAVAAVGAGRFDIGLARCPVGLGDLERVNIRDEPIGIVLGSTHPLACHDPVDLAELVDTPLAIWPRSQSPGFYDRVVGFLRAHGFNGAIQEFEYLTSGLFHGDPSTRHQVVEGRAFSVAFASQFETIPPAFVWRPIEPCPLIPVDVFWRRSAGSATLNFVQIALSVAAKQRWLAADQANATLAKINVRAGP